MPVGACITLTRTNALLLLRTKMQRNSGTVSIGKEICLKDKTVRLTDDELALHFEKLYSTCGSEESAKIEELSTTNTYSPSLDDQITKEELVSPLLLLFFNAMFYLAYPTSLALSCLPKQGNLSLPNLLKQGLSRI